MAYGAATVEPAIRGRARFPRCVEVLVPRLGLQRPLPAMVEVRRPAPRPRPLEMQGCALGHRQDGTPVNAALLHPPGTSFMFVQVIPLLPGSKVQTTSKANLIPAAFFTQPRFMSAIRPSRRSHSRCTESEPQSDTG